MKRILLLVALLIFAACGSAETTQVEEDVMIEESAEVVNNETDSEGDSEMADDAAMDDGDEEISEEPAINPDMMTEEDAMADEDAATEDAAHDDTAMSDDDAMSDDGSMADDDAAMTEDNAMADDDAAMADDDAMTDDAAMTDEAAVDTSNLAAWQTLPLTNAHTGETFTLADFAGKTVFVEPMATWCTNCRRQLGNVQVAKTQSADDVVFIGLSLETTLTSENLAEYANINGFDFIWAVLSPEMVRELAAEFGQTITNPPSTPHFIVRSDGSVAMFTTGIESADELLEQIALAMQ